MTNIKLKQYPLTSRSKPGYNNSNPASRLLFPSPLNHPRRTNAFRDSCERQYITAAQNLYDKLIKPVKSQLREELIIVPDGVLGYVPFEVLLSGPAPQNTKRYQQYPYLLKEHRIRYSYSATLLQEMTDKQHRRAPEKPFGAFAPYYDGDTSVMAGLTRLHQQNHPARRPATAEILWR